jgi:hypothetical protein
MIVRRMPETVVLLLCWSVTLMEPTPVASTSIIIQPYDGSWRMGEDYVLNISIDQTVIQLMQLIEKIKGISAHRQQIRLSNNKLITKSREIWALRRHGIQNNTKIKIEPTRPGAWLWNDYEYYVEKFLSEIIHLLHQTTSPILLSELEQRVAYPPCFISTFRVFLRQHPDRILLRTDLGNGNIWVQLTRNGLIQLPKYEPLPLCLGYNSRYDPEEFDWDEHYDDDSVKPLESQITLPDVFYEIAINCGQDFGYYGTLNDTNPFIVIFKDGKFLGNSVVKTGTRKPRWNSARFSVGFQFGSSLGDHSLTFEVWNMKVLSDHLSPALTHSPLPQISLQKLQYLHLTGADLASFLQPPEEDVYRDYYLENYILEQEQRQQKSRVSDELSEIGRRGDIVSGVEESASLVEERIDEPMKGEGVGVKASQEVEDEEVEEDIVDPFLQKKLFREASEKEKLAASVAIQINPNTSTTNLKHCLLTTCSRGLLTLMGSKTTYQLRILGAYELTSHETLLSEEIQPLIIVIWNGIDIGQTSTQRHTRWASWSDAVFNIHVPGNMEPGQCVLECQVWNVEEVGGGKKLMSNIVLTGRPLRELLTKKAPYAMHQILELQLPHLEEKPNDSGAPQHHHHHNQKKKEKNKTQLSGGSLSIIGGLVGLHEPDKSIRYYELQILLGVGMARTEVQCVIFWNSIQIGKTDSTPMVTEKVATSKSGVTQSKWIWKQNKFILKLFESDLIKESELKIDCYDPSTKGSNSYIGCAILSQEELVSFLDQPYVVQQLVTLKKDPKREDKRVTKGTLTIRGGKYGGRLETERLFEIRGVEFSNGKPTNHSPAPVGESPFPGQGADEGVVDSTRGDDVRCFCVVYWNDEYLGSTNSIRNDGYPVWELFDQRWFYLSDTQASPLYYANGVLLIELWEGDSTTHERNSTQTISTFIGSIQLTGNQLEDFMESNITTAMKVQLTSYRKLLMTTQSKPKKFLLSRPALSTPTAATASQGVIDLLPVYLILSTPGKQNPTTPMMEIEKQEILFNQLLDNELTAAADVEKIFEEKK